MTSEKLRSVAGFPRQQKVLKLIHFINGKIIDAVKDGKFEVDVNFEAEEDLEYDSYIIRNALKDFQTRDIDWKNEDFVDGEWRFTFSW